MPKTSPPRTAAAPPTSAEEGAAHVRKFMVELFNRKDGHAVDWKMIAGTLFRAGFEVLDELPPDQKSALCRRIHERSYVPSMDDSAPSKNDVSGADSGLANIAGFKSSDPGPGKPH